MLPHHSLARVNRELGKAIVALDAVRYIPQGEPTPNVERTFGVEPCRIEDVAMLADATTFTVQHAWPARYRRPKRGYSIHMQPYEFGTLPVPWVEQSIELADDIWCYTNYVRRLYIDCGMPAERTHVIPLGFDPAIYRPDIAPYDVGSSSVFIFLFVGGAIWRKGIDTLVDAYMAAFTTADDVMLVIKDFGATTFYTNSNARERIVELSQRSDIPMVRYTAGDMSDGGLASLYRRADVLVHPYRGEGFGLPVLEAMACGTAPMVTAGGATDDFVTGETGFRLPARRLELGTSFVGLEHTTPGWVFDVDPALLAAEMRHAFEHRDEVRERGTRAAGHVHRSFTWAHGARAVVDRLDELAARPSRGERGDEEITAYELRALSRHGEDGLLMELFGRLRVTDPVVVEFGAGPDSNGAALTQKVGWRGVAFETPPSIGDADALLRRHDVPQGFDLLSIDGAADARELWDAVAGYAPRAVIIQQPIDADVTVPPGGYAFLGRDTSRASALYVRRDLLAACGLPERRSTESPV